MMIGNRFSAPAWNHNIFENRPVTNVVCQYFPLDIPATRLQSTFQYNFSVFPNFNPIHAANIWFLMEQKLKKIYLFIF